jgi:uncharacterized protein YjdB
LSNATIYIKKGSYATVTARNLAAGDKVKSYSSSKKSVATVSSKGMVTAKKTGTTTIRITTVAGRTDTIKVRVVSKSYPARSINIPSAVTLKIGKLYRTSVTASPSNTTSTLKWSSSNTSVATVNAAGYIYPKKVGKTTITVKTSSGKSDKCTLTVIPSVRATDIELSRDTASIYAGKTVDLNYTMMPASSNDTVAWSTSNSKVATVSSSGLVTGKGYGEAKITAKTGSGKTASAIISVSVISAKRSLSQLTPGTRIYPFTVYGSDKIVKCTTSNSKLATVSSSGLVTANLRNESTGNANTGTVTITATTATGGKTTAKIKVVNNPTIVDLSKWQGDITWSSASKSIDLAILRVSYGNDTDIEFKYDSYSTSCKTYGVPFGVYSYVRYTKGKAAAEKQAEIFYKKATVGGRMPAFFVADCEESNITRAWVEYYIAKLRSLAEKQYGKGYRVKVGVYAGHHLYTKLGLNLTPDPSNPKTPDFVWIPRYSTANLGTISGCTPPNYPCEMWQYSSGGRIPGISGLVDMNTLTKEDGTMLSTYWSSASSLLAWLKTPAKMPVTPPAVNYTVSFDNSGVASDMVQTEYTVVSGATFTQPAVYPTSATHDFGGWYADAAFATPFDFSKPITANTVIYVKWVEKSVSGDPSVDEPDTPDTPDTPETPSE